MSFKGISYLELCQPFCSVEQTHLCNSVEGIMRNNYLIFFEFGPVVQEENTFKISYLELWRRSCSMERNHSCNYEIGHHGDSCEVI